VEKYLGIVDEGTAYLGVWRQLASRSILQTLDDGLKSVSVDEQEGIRGTSAYSLA
jgi:hypothetical protein